MISTPNLLWQVPKILRYCNTCHKMFGVEIMRSLGYGTQKPEFGHFTISDFFSRNSYYSTVPRVLNPVNVTTFWGVTTILRHPRVLGIIVNVLEVS